MNIILLFQRLSIWFGCVLLICDWAVVALLQRLIITFEYSFPTSSYQTIRRYFIQTTMIIIRIFCRLKLQVEGELSDNTCNYPFILVANHQSPFDVLLIAYLFQYNNPHFVMRKGIEYGIPLFSYTARKKMGVILNEKNLKDSIHSLRLSANNLRTGHHIVIFPEGVKNSTTYPRLQPFKKFGLKVLLKNAPDGTFVLPMAISGTSKFFMSFSTGIHFGATVHIRFLSAIEINKDEINMVCHCCEQNIRQALFELEGIKQDDLLQD